MLSNEEWKFVRWYDWLWLLIPMCGFLPFYESIKRRARRERK